MTAATATEVQNNFGKFLRLVLEGQEVVITKNGKDVARIISKDRSVSFLSDNLLGVLSHDVDEKKARKERVKKYESIG